MLGGINFPRTHAALALQTDTNSCQLLHKEMLLVQKEKKKGGKILSEILDPLISVGVLLLGISKADATLLSILTDN